MSNMVYYTLIILCVFANAFGGLLMKVGAKSVSFGQGESLVKTAMSMATNWQLLIGIVFFGSSFVLSTLVYTKISLNIAYPIIMAGTLLIISLVSFIFLDEKFTLVQGLGTLLLITGIFMITRGMKNG